MVDKQKDDNKGMLFLLGTILVGGVILILTGKKEKKIITEPPTLNEKIVVQYGSTDDKNFATQLQSYLQSKGVIVTLIEGNDIPEFGLFNKIFLIGGECGNNLFATLCKKDTPLYCPEVELGAFGLNLFDNISNNVKTNEVFIQVNNINETKFYSVAGITPTETLLSVNWIIINGIPTQTVKQQW